MNRSLIHIRFQPLRKLFNAVKLSALFFTAVFQHPIGIRCQIDLQDPQKKSRQHAHRILQISGNFIVQCDRIAHSSAYR